MCGDHGFVNSIENIFTFGFKSVKLFKRLYIWDFLGIFKIFFKTVKKAFSKRERDTTPLP